jgi:hypothetical protein
MAIRHLEPGGRMHNATANIISNWDTINDSTHWTVSATNGRNGGSCLRWAASSSFSLLMKSFTAQQTWGIAFGLRVSGAPTAGCGICALYDSGSIQVELALKSDLTLVVTRGNNGTVLGTSSSALTLNTYYHIEWKVKIDPTVGTLELRINEVAKIGPLTSLNTRNTSNSFSNSIALGYSGSYNAGGFGNVDFDDIIIWDTVTTDAQGNTDIHDFIGDYAIAVLMPTGVGNSSDFTADSGTNYARVNETTPVTSSYVESLTTGQIDTYSMSDLPAGALTPKNVGIFHYIEKTDVGPKQAGAVLRTNSTNYINTNGIDLSNSFQYVQRFWGTNPDTAAAWTVTQVNALEAGQTVNS